MQSTAKHTRFFGLIYNATPCSNIFGCIMICIRNITTIFTIKSFSISFSDMETNVASLRSIGRWNSKQFYTIKCRLISQILSKLVKTPTIQLCLLCLAFWICFFSNITQIFNGNAFVFCLCFCNYLFTYCVVIDGNKSTFPATKPFQKFISSFCAFALNACSNFSVFFTNFFKLFRIVIGAIRKSANISLTKITSYKFFHIFNIFFRHFYGLEYIKLSFFKYKISLSFYIRKVFSIMANKLNFQSAADRPNRDYLLGWVSKYTAIIRNRTRWLKYSFCFLIKFISISHFRNTTYQYLRTKIRTAFYFMIDLFVNFELIKYFQIRCNFRNNITSGISFFDSLKQTFGLLIIRQQFYFKCQFHLSKNNSII